MDAAVFIQKCGKSRKVFAVRTQKMEDGDWWRTWAFPLDEGRARNEGYDKTDAQGNLYATEEFPGCPYCGTDYFFQCGKCSKISCWHQERSAVCPWCNTRIQIRNATTKFRFSGGDL